MAQPFDNINSFTVTILPPSEIINRSYKSDTKQPEYVGHAIKGTSNSTALWTVRKFTFNANNQIATERIAHNIA